MGGINVGRWILGGLAAGVVFNVFEAIAGSYLHEQWEAAAAAHNLPSDSGWGVYVLMGFIAGLVVVWLYAAARTRFGPGPGTAVKVAVFYWAGSFLIAVLGYCAMRLFPTGMLVTWGFTSLIETIVATIVGAWLYREKPAATA